jgi:Carboxypeptidase regulatory-like domain
MNSRTVFHPAKGALLSLALALLTSAGVQARDNSSGNIAGTATPGDTVTATNPDTGLTRTITVEADGRFRLPQLPIGTYIVTIKHADGAVYVTTPPLKVQIGLTTRIKQN